MKDIVFVDIEVYHDFFYVGMKRESDGRRIGFEMSRRTAEGKVPAMNPAKLASTMAAHTMVGFNCQGYDIPLIALACAGATNAELKSASDRIIENRVRWWDVEDVLDCPIPRAWDFIDLIEPQPNAWASLKALNGRLHGRRMQDLPFDPKATPTDEQMGVLADYCLVSDLDATENLWRALKEPMEMRLALGKLYQQDFRSKSDSQIGEAIVKKRVQQLTGRRPQKAEVKAGATFRYPVPDFLRFDRPDLQALLEQIRETEFVVKADGKADLPKWLGEQVITIGEMTCSLGIGGLHSTESQRAVKSDESHVLIDADVAGQYPKIILTLGLAPKSLGPDFLTVYQSIYDERIVAKRAKDKVKDKGFKIALNGCYGKLGSRYSILHAPHLMVSVTLTGQLTLLMLIEQAEKAGVPVVSANTDGVLLRCPRSMFAGVDGVKLADSPLADITRGWERATGFELEFAEYAGIYNASVNSYFAIKADGGHKRKGPVGNPWSTDPNDYDARALLMKNPQATICSDAALAFIKHGTPVEKTILDCTDIRQFVTVIAATGGATWRGEYLGKTVRYYWSLDGSEILEAKPHPTTGNHKKVSKTDGARPMMLLADEIPADLDYERYFQEARDILVECGAVPPPPPPRRRKVFRGKPTFEKVIVWAMVDL